MRFVSTYHKKRVLVTGHTGFKGSWLSNWLVSFGAEVHGIADGIPTTPSLFEATKLADRIQHHVLDVRDRKALVDRVSKIRPDFVFHLAAQSLVRRSYADAATTFETNAMGTLNMLEALRELKSPCTAVLITSDKVYDNQEWVWGYREDDALGGRDPYSASKGAAELIIKGYLHSFFGSGSPVRLAVGRAGNVIGGGDWAADRIVPDAIRAWVEKRAVEVRQPESTRPWQHVLEPLSGYLALGEKLAGDPRLHGQAFNFGPSPESDWSVGMILDEMKKHWPSAAWRHTPPETKVHEANLLKLNCDKALNALQWRPALRIEEALRWTVEWYAAFYTRKEDALKLCQHQFESYRDLAGQRAIAWALSL